MSYKHAHREGYRDYVASKYTPPRAGEPEKESLVFYLLFFGMLAWPVVLALFLFGVIPTWW